MKVVICGAGRVGRGIAEQLVREKNDVTIVDMSTEMINAISDELDVKGIVGHASHPDILESAGLDAAEMIIAVTLHDEINMMACQVAHSLFNVPTKIARVRSQTYLDLRWANLFSTDHVPIDVIISPELEVSKTVIQRLEFPGAFEIISFADEQLIVAGVVCEESCPIVDTPLRQLSQLFSDLDSVVFGVWRTGEMFTPSADEILQVGDVCYFSSKRDQVLRTLNLFGHVESSANRVVVAGGGNIGQLIATHFENHWAGMQVRVIEANRQRAEIISSLLSRSIVLHGSALDRELLREADIHGADMFVALTNDDQVNILSSVMACHEGCKSSLCLVNNSNYFDALYDLGITAYIDPRAITVSRVLQHVRRGRIRGVYSLKEGAAEVIEAEALDTSPLVGIPLSQLNISSGIRFGAVVRGKNILRPHGELVIEPGDRVILFALASYVKKVEQLFRVSFDFF